MKKLIEFEGLLAAPFTPMDKQGNVMPDLVPEYYKMLEENGITGAFVNGSTGEGASLSQKEKQIMAGKWAECYKSGGKIRIINLVGGTCYKECIENAIFSFEAGISAIAVVAPYYFKPPDEGHLAEYCAMVGEAVPQMPVYFYHIPGLSGVNFPMIKFLEKISGMLPNFAGIKYTHEDSMDFLSCLRYMEGAYDILCGKDENFLPSLALGCKAAIGSTFNYAAPLYHELLRNYREDNLHEAQRLQMLSIEMIRLLGKYGGMGVGKAFMKYIGFDCGKFRLPVKNLTDEMYPAFAEDVKRLKMEKYFSRVHR
ncbi:MAG: dihydrodipicolinate synthase family protein [Bacteroidales bacterium]|nr:dihydrodipicolinate synthase family protein [Bacteroidales bacterium]